MRFVKPTTDQETDPRMLKVHEGSPTIPKGQPTRSTDAVIIPAYARGAFHLPPTANKAANRAARYVR